MKTATLLVYGSRAGLIEISLTNVAKEPRDVPLTVNAAGTLDPSERWEFDAPLSTTRTTRTIADGSLRLEQGKLAVVVRGDRAIRWRQERACGEATVSLPPSGQATLFIVFAIGPTAEADAACKAIADAPERAMMDSAAFYARRVRELFQRLPTLKSNHPALVRLYDRSLVHLLMNRWDVSEFALHPYYGTGSVGGGCVCEYLWNFGENWEIFPLYDVEAARTHIAKFLSLDMKNHYAFDPATGAAFGPWYMVNPETIVGMIYYYVKNTGDIRFLREKVAGKTVLEHAIINATLGDEPAKPVAMIDYGSSNSHLELRRGLPYNHVMPDLNGRRYNNYVFAAELAELAGNPEPTLRQRAEQLKSVLKNRLWNEDARWFDFEDDKGHKDARYTLQMFKLFGSKVLDGEEEAGLLSHLLSETEFLSKFGLHSLAKTDPAYDPEDVDNGGPGACTSFVPQIAERLYKADRPDAAENLLKRILWWGERMPYWGDSIVADKIDYRRDTPLQCVIDGAAVAQCVFFGMFGVRAESKGDVYVNPRPPVFTPKIQLQQLRIRGHVLDIAVSGGEYEVREGAKRFRARIGQPILVQRVNLR